VSGPHQEQALPAVSKMEGKMKHEILEIPRALRLMWAKGRTQYDALVRQGAWSEKPVFITGSNSSYWAALTGAYAFESLLRLPAVARTPEVFNAYTSSSLAFRSLLVAISPSGECEKTLEAARRAKARGAIVWALTANPASALGKLADGIAEICLHEASADGIQAAFCQHAAMVFLALAAARALRRPAALLATQEMELEKLPESIERVQNQFTDAARALAGEIGSLLSLLLTGGGLYHPVALQAAYQLAELAGVPARGLELLDFQHILPTLPQTDTGVLILSGSRCALKAEVHQAARDAGKKAGGKLFAITDSNDHQLSERVTLSVLLPTLTEPAGALLALAFLNSVTNHAVRHSSAPSNRGRHSIHP
jgi:glucosamine 6-phosphate synthetase-like amidotransferase/phosphosugar isomerase protein